MADVHQLDRLYPRTEAVRVEMTEDLESSERPIQSFWRRNALLVLIAIGVAVGFCLGFGLRPYHLNDDAIMWLGLPGHMFMNMIKLTIIPLIAGSIITGTATSDPKSNGRIGILTIGFIVTANCLGAVLGIIIHYIFNPGQYVTQASKGSSTGPDSQHLQTQDMFADLIRNIMPANIISATFQKTQTRYIMTSSIVDSNGTNVTVQMFVRHVGVASGTNLIGLILISAVVGMAASSVKESSVSFVPFFQATSDIFIRMMKWFIWSTPVGVASLICVSLLQVNNIEDTFRSLGMYLLSYTVGILIQKLLIIPAVYFLVLRKNPFSFLLSAARPWLTVLSPASTAIGMPDMMNVCENIHHVRTTVSRFAIPIGVSICRAGSAYFISLSSLFIVSLTGSQPSASDVLLIGIMTTLGSLAIPAIPTASPVTIIIILSSMNIDATRVGLLMALEWYTDRLRSTCNALHIMTCTVVVDKLCASQLGGKDSGNNIAENEKLITTAVSSPV